MDLKKLLFRLGLRETGLAGHAGIAQQATFFQRDRSLKERKEAFGAWLNIPGWNVQLAFDEDDLPLVPAPSTLYLFHNAANGESLVQLRSLLNRVKRQEKSRPDVLIFDSEFVSPALSSLLLGVEKIPATGAASFITDGKIRSRMVARNEFNSFRDSLLEG
jgi:hypothetical protein